jgi:hypothetical protein
LLLKFNYYVAKLQQLTLNLFINYRQCQLRIFFNLGFYELKMLMKLMWKRKTLIISTLFALISYGCSGNKDPVSGENRNIEPNATERTKRFAEQGGGIFGDINKIGKKSEGTFEFASSNVLWRATIKTLDFLPLANADYSGGIIIYDWFSQTNNPKEQIKISIQFLSNELRSDSIKITAHKKICESIDRCSNSTLDQNFANSIKDSIITSARALKIEEAKKEKK